MTVLTETPKTLWWKMMCKSDENYKSSDFEERYVGPPELSSDVDSDLPVTSNTSCSATQNTFIQLCQRNVERKNIYVWASTKGNTSTGTGKRNMVRTARGPIHSCRGFTSEWSCFEKFFTNQVFEEIMEWRNVQIYGNKGAIRVFVLLQKLTI